ncbi:MAG: RDD family protein [Flavobacteriaceae bacterium]|nr:RDD family protein [Flavobacteriaceae bacterium]
MNHFIKRTIAYLIDCLICYTFIMLIFQWALLSNLRVMIGITHEWFESSLNLQLYVFLTISLPVWFYFTYLDSNKSSGTIGKRIMKLAVLDYKKEKVRLKKSFLRTIFKLSPWEIAHFGIIFPSPLYFSQNPDIRILTIFGLILFGAYMLSIIIDSNRQSLYDKLLCIKVIEK